MIQNKIKIKPGIKSLFCFLVGKISRIEVFKSDILVSIKMFSYNKRVTEVTLSFQFLIIFHT